MTVTDHMQRLPIVRQLDASQQRLVKLTPGWNRWLADHITCDVNHQAKLSAFKNGVLLIACENAAIATQIKHQQHSLVEYFHKLGFGEVNKVTARLTQFEQTSLNPNNGNSISPGPDCAPSLQDKSEFNQPSGRGHSEPHTQISKSGSPSSSNNHSLNHSPNKQALDALTQCQKSVKSEGLSDALQRLEKTLKNNQ